MKTIALVTYSEEPQLTADDRLVLEHLKNGGAATEIVNWDSAETDWLKFDAVVLRSCWEYHLRTREFLSWLDRMEQLGVRLQNSAETVRRNIDKFYLRELSAKGALVPPSVWIRKNEPFDLAKILDANGWSRAVVKPAISMSAYQTWITAPERATADQQEIERILETSGVVVQNFIGEVETRGEWSFVFLGGEYSHAVLKRPRKGDFRVQRDLGGRVDARAEPGISLLEQAKKIYDLIDEPLLYARVDGVDAGGAFTLMELELIDPVLFLGFQKEAPEKFAKAILSL
jgi:glutathione synthase/RimK-type ligase-like ATP-grasp enzyme